MKAEQKAALIKFIQREKTTCYELDTRDFCEPEIADFMRYGEVLEIALASLTAPPVPVMKPVKCPSFDDYKPHIARELREAFKAALREAGIQIEGEE